MGPALTVLLYYLDALHAQTNHIALLARTFTSIHQIFVSYAILTARVKNANLQLNV